MSIPEDVLKALKKVKDPHTGESLMDAGMIKDVVVSGKKVSLKLIPSNLGCAGCGMTAIMNKEIEDSLKAAGYEPEVEVSFE